MIKPERIMIPPIPMIRICLFLSIVDNFDHDFIFKPMNKPIIKPKVIPMKNPI
jgi:hypothetical protein